MFRHFTFHDNFADILSGAWWMFLAQGMAFILFGILVMLVPKILVVMVSLALICIGIFFLLIAWQVRQSKVSYRVWKNDFWQPFNQF